MNVLTTHIFTYEKVLTWKVEKNLRLDTCDLNLKTNE